MESHPGLNASPRLKRRRASRSAAKGDAASRWRKPISRPVGSTTKASRPKAVGTGGQGSRAPGGEGRHQGVEGLGAEDRYLARRWPDRLRGRPSGVSGAWCDRSSTMSSPHQK